MKLTETRTVWTVLIAIVLVLGGLPFLKGGFFVGKHEGDTLHMAEIVLRMARGDWPHLDFMTPIGVLAMAPMALFVKLGAGLGHSIFLAQILVALVLLPAVVRTATSRFTPLIGLLFAAYVMILCVALVHGEAEQSVSISMHYNRWAWAIVYTIVPLAVLSPASGRARPWLDGGLIGLGLGLLVLVKVTFFVAIAPAVLIALCARKSWSMLAAGALAGLAVAAATTIVAGPTFWLAYLGDLATVAASEIRAAPGMDFHAVAASPTHIGASMALLATIIFLRQSGRMTEGMVLLFLMPGLIYVTYQNFGNDPQWLILVAALALSLRPQAGLTNGRGWELRQCLTYAGLAALAFGLPSLINLAYSPIRHHLMDTEDFLPLLPAQTKHHDVLAASKRMYGVITTSQGDQPGMPFEVYFDKAEHPDLADLNGEKLPYCEQIGGLVAWFDWVAKDLMAAGYSGKRIMTTDFYSSFWMFGDFEPVPRGAPWYYGGLPGIENADYILVPVCPIGDKLRTLMLSALGEAGYRLTEVRRTPVYILVQPLK